MCLCEGRDHFSPFPCFNYVFHKRSRRPCSCALDLQHSEIPCAAPGCPPHFFPSVPQTAWGLYRCILPSTAMRSLVKIFNRVTWPGLSTAPPVETGDSRRAVPAELGRPPSATPHLHLVRRPRTRNRAPCSSILSHFDATNLFYTAVAVDLFPSSTCTPSENVRHSRVRQHSG